MAIDSKNAIVYTILDKRKTNRTGEKTATLKFNPNNAENRVVISHKIGNIETDFYFTSAELLEMTEWLLMQGVKMQMRADACKLNCSPSDYAPGGKCEQNGCRQKDA